MDRRAWLLAVVFVVIDTCTTWYGITQLGLSEGNPIVVWLMSRYGVLPALVVVKVVLVAIALYLFTVVEADQRHRVPGIVATVHGIVVVFNVVAIGTAL